MAYQVSKTSALQTAIKAAVDIAVAELGAGILNDHEALMERVGDLQDQFTAALYMMVDLDNAVLNGSTAPRPEPTLHDALGMELTWGAFKGAALGEVLQMDSDEAADYTNGRFKRAGKEWLEWVAQSNEPKAQFVAKAAQLVLSSS